MSNHHLSNEEFLIRLGNLFRTVHTKNHGSVFLTQKSLQFSQPSTCEDIASSEHASEAVEHLPRPASILIRATDGKSKRRRQQSGKNRSTPNGKEKLSTVVEVGASGADSAAEDFWGKYAEVCKKGMEGLRKRDRKKAKKKKEKGKKATSVGTITPAAKVV